VLFLAMETSLEDCFVALVIPQFAVYGSALLGAYTVSRGAPRTRHVAYGAQHAHEATRCSMARGVSRAHRQPGAAVNASVRACSVAAEPCR
jgi:hypothetical protein